MTDVPVFRTRNIRHAIAIGLLACSSLAAAEPYGYYDPARHEDSESDVEPFTGDASVSFADVSGNTNSRALAADLDATWEQDQWRQRVQLTALNEQSEGEATAERYGGAAQVDRKLAGPGYVFLRGEYESDRFSGYDYRANAATGYGRRLIDDGTVTLDAEAGPGYRYSELEEDGDAEPDPGVADGGELTARGALRAEWAINDSATLQHNLTVETGDLATITTAELRLRTRVLKPLSLQVGYRLRNVTETPADVENTDTRFTVGIAYEF